MFQAESPTKEAANTSGTGGESVGQAVVTPEPARPETAWERGLRQAKEMRKRSQQRKETDIEYEEKRTNMSLTQVKTFCFRFLQQERLLKNTATLRHTAQKTFLAIKF